MTHFNATRLVLALGLLLTATASHADQKNKVVLVQPTTKPVIFSALDGLAWAKLCVERHPEVLWLANAEVRKTEEGQASTETAYSDQLFGQKHIEFDRTLMTIRCLKLVIDGSDESYKEFTEVQPEGSKLKKESFQILHQHGQELLKSGWGGLTAQEMAQAMETALVLGDIGKSEKARAVFKSFHIQAPDHDDFHGEAMQVLKKHPDLCPSFLHLPEKGKELLVKVANLAHYGHLTHLEGSAHILTKLKESKIASSDPTAHLFDLFVHTCDVAGALGHVNNRSSLTYTEQTHRALQATWDAAAVLSNPEKTEWDAYNAYLAKRASWIGLNPKNGADRVLTRIAAMLRLFTPEEGAILKKGMLQLDKATRAKIVAQLDAQNDAPTARTPTYMPTVLLNLSNNPNIGATREERLVKAIALGLPAISKVLEKHKEQLQSGKADPNVPLNFNAMGGIAKTAPDALLQEFAIDHEGCVYLKTESQ